MHNPLDAVRALHLNLYDFAIWSPEGAIYDRLQPSNNCNDSYSVAKAFVMTAVGMLFDDRRLDPAEPILKYFGRVPGMDEKWARVTIDHALTHRIGFDEGFLDIDAEDVNAYPTDDYLQLALSHPLALQPGEERHYSDAAFYLLSRLVERVSGQDVEAFLNDRLFRPARFREYAWSRCPLGHPIGATGLYLRADDMVRLGAIYAGRGVYEGRRYLSEEWIERAYAREYELHPRAASANPDRPEWRMKGGMHGQGLLIHASRPLAAAWHGFMDEDHSQEIIDCLSDLYL